MPLPELKPEVIEKLIRMGRPQSVFDDTFTERVLKQIADQSHTQPSRKHPALDKTDLAKLKYQVLGTDRKKGIAQDQAADVNGGVGGATETD